MNSCWRNKYTEPSATNGCWVLPSNEEILQDFRSFGACILTYLSALTEHAGWQRVFLLQLFERMITDKEFYQSFSQVHQAGQCADALMRGIAYYSQEPPHFEVVEAPAEGAHFKRGH